MPVMAILGLFFRFFLSIYGDTSPAVGAVIGLFDGESLLEVHFPALAFCSGFGYAFVFAFAFSARFIDLDLWIGIDF